MSSPFKNVVAAVVDFTLFFILWLGFNINWIIAFFLSTLIVIAVWWIAEWSVGWASYLLGGLK